MLFIFLSILITVALFVLLGVTIKGGAYDRHIEWGFKNKQIISLAGLLAILFGCICVVPTGHTGVVATFGRVEDIVLDEGFHFKSPIEKVVKMDNRAQKSQITLQAFSSDIQQVDVICTLNYSIDRSTSQNLYKNVGKNYYLLIIEPRILENVKAVFAKYTAENLITSRSELSSQIAKNFAPEMKAYGVEVISITLEDIDFTDVFTNAVEAKQVAEQKKLQASIEQEQKIIEANSAAERQVIEANAAAEQSVIAAKAAAEQSKIAAEAQAGVTKVKADAEAYAVEIKAKAEAEANKGIANSLTASLIEYQEINKWNGQLPTYMGGDGVLPILNID